MIPHVDVHRRSHDDWSRGGEIKRGEKVAGDALREVGQNIGSGGRNKQSVNRLRHGNVLDGRVDVGSVLFARREHSGNHFFAGERGEGKRTNKLLSRARHDDLHANAAVLQQPHNFGCLVSGDAARYSKSNFHNGEWQRLKARSVGTFSSCLKA